MYHTRYDERRRRKVMPENSMGTQKVSRLVLTTGIPLMLSLLINSLYNFVDSVFVSRVAEDALTGVSLAAPVQIMVSALGLGNAVGLNAAISRALGEGRRDKVRKTASAAIFLALCAWVLISVACLAGVRRYFDWQSGGNADIAAYGRDYLTICMLFSLGQMGQWVFDRFVIASGKSHLFLFTLSAASVTNLILDPVFIFGFGMGTRGAAIATVIGQHVGLLAGSTLGDDLFRVVLPALSVGAGDSAGSGIGTVQRLCTDEEHRTSRGTDHGSSVAHLHSKPGYGIRPAGTFSSMAEHIAHHAQAGGAAGTAGAYPESIWKSESDLGGFRACRNSGYTRSVGTLEARKQKCTCGRDTKRKVFLREKRSGMKRMRRYDFKHNCFCRISHVALVLSVGY